MATLRVFPSLPAESQRLHPRQLPEIEGVVPASRLGVRPRPRTIPTGISQVDELTGGIPRGGLTEILGSASSGRTSLLLSVLAQATAREEVCALIDAGDAFDPHSAVAAGVDLKRLLWVRCGENPPQRHGGTEKVSGFKFQASRSQRETRNVKRETFWRVEQALRALDLLLGAGGFGLLAMDLADIPPRIVRRIPLTSWFRFRRAVENTATALLVLEPEASAKSCASLVLGMKHSAISIQHTKTEQSALSIQRSAKSDPTHTRLLCRLQLNVAVLESRTLQRKPVRSATTGFTTRASWVG